MPFGADTWSYLKTRGAVNRIFSSAPKCDDLTLVQLTDTYMSAYIASMVSGPTRPRFRFVNWTASA